MKCRNDAYSTSSVMNNTIHTVAFHTNQITHFCLGTEAPAPAIATAQQHNNTLRANELKKKNKISYKNIFTFPPSPPTLPYTAL